MSAGMLFFILLIIGMLIEFLGIKAANKGKAILIILGVITILIAVFGIFTYFL
jgi:hypothetical protein